MQHIDIACVQIRQATVDVPSSNASLVVLIGATWNGADGRATTVAYADCDTFQDLKIKIVKWIVYLPQFVMAFGMWKHGRGDLSEN